MLIIGAVLAVGAAGTAGAAGLPQIIHARQNHFRALGRTFKSLRDQTWGSRPNWRIVASDADQIERLASALPNWFPPGSGQGHGVKTRASKAIWARPQAFARAAQRLLNQARGLQQASVRRDRRALVFRTRELGHACGSCHRQFRARSSWW
jgi:cytochrome c556